MKPVQKSLPHADRVLSDQIRAMLRGAAVPENAATMRSYMKSEMPFLGVAQPVHRAAVNRLVRVRRPADFETWRDTVLLLWREAGFREERYCAIHVARHRLADAYQTLAAMPLYEEMVTTGAWWDLVDALAPYRFPDLIDAAAATMGKTLRAWARSDDVWKRRAAIISQLKRKSETDERLLADCIMPSMGESEFFLRKGIGWALREHAKTDPRWVVAFVTEHRERLSPLSKREAVRTLVKDGLLDAVP